jgi:RNA polymerase sigma factor (sigma-70 family)
VLPFEQVVATHAAMVLRVCRAVVGPVDADDAWSETFLAALRAYPDLPVDADVAAWLVTIAHRKAIDVRRGATRRALPLAELPEPPVAGPGWSGDDVVEHADLYAALAALPERQRLTVAYHYLAGHRYADIARLVGGTEAAARRAAADGIKALRDRHLPRAGASR